MNTTVLAALLALTLNSDFLPRASRTKPPPATEKPRPPPPPPPSKPGAPEDEPEPEKPERERRSDREFDMDDVLPVIRGHELLIQECYARTRSGARHKAEVIVEFDIDPEGRVTRERIAESRMASPELERCILQQVRSWRFRRNDSFTAPPFHVRHPFSFQTL